MRKRPQSRFFHGIFSHFVAMEMSTFYIDRPVPETHYIVWIQIPLEMLDYSLPEYRILRNKRAGAFARVYSSPLEDS